MKVKFRVKDRLAESPGMYGESTLYLRITAERNLVHRIAAAIRAALGGMTK